jgi:hypothetical protein
MLQTEYLSTVEPPVVRISGDPAVMDLLHDGLTVMGNASVGAEASGQPFICTPDEAKKASTDWAANLRGYEPEIREVSPSTAALAYRGLVRAHSSLEELRAATYGSTGGNEPFAERRIKTWRAIADLAGMKADLTTAGYFEPAAGLISPGAE